MNIRFRQRQWTGSPPADTAPEPGEVITWFVGLPLDAQSRERIFPILSDEERERMARFSQPADRERFLAGRGVLRSLLGKCLRIPPQAVVLINGSRGKPLLAPGQSAPLHFSVAHSGHVVAIALSATCAVGVDIEALDPLHDWHLVAKRILSRSEVTEMETVPPVGRPRAFLNAWTRKEAVLKATGEGLVDDLALIEVSLAPGTPVRPLSLGGIVPGINELVLHELAAPFGYVASAAACRPQDNPAGLAHPLPR